MAPHTDAFQRTIDYLRVSVTDRCNLRCVYCMPPEGVPSKAHDMILRYEEIARLVRVAAGLGISRVRLTGGEPLVRRGFADLVRLIAAIPGISDLSMTTNGTLLAQHAAALRSAGLQRVNVSLDTLNPLRFGHLTRLGRLDDVLEGMRVAAEVGLSPVKVNVVVMRGENDGEIPAFARRTITHGWHVRFIEVLPIGEGRHLAEDGYVSSAEVRARLERDLGSPLERATLGGAGPAAYWRVPGASGTIGFISALSEHFCGQCNRLRLGADGQLLPCLFTSFGSEVDLRGPLRSGAGDQLLAELFVQAMAAKPAGHGLARPNVADEGRPLDYPSPARDGRPMSAVGG